MNATEDLIAMIAQRNRVAKMLAELVLTVEEHHASSEKLQGDPITRTTTLARKLLDDERLW